MHARSEPPHIDFDGINATALAAYPGLLQRQFPAGRLHGREFVLGDLSGAPGESLSINSVTGKWSDFATDQKGGDPISLWAAAFHGGERVAAAKALRDHLGIGTGAEVIPLRKHAPPPAKGFHWAKPPVDQVGKAPIARWDHAYPYRDAAGELLFYVVRNDARGDEKKKIMPLAYGELGDVVGWHHKHLETARPLYGLDRLAASPEAIVLIVEGEKAVAAAEQLAPETVPVTWCGGSSAIEQTDWSPLAGRRCIVWPDADAPGAKARDAIVQRLAELDTRCSVIDVAGQPDGWDAADAVADGWTAEKTKTWLRERLRSSAPATPALPEPPPASELPDGPSPDDLDPDDAGRADGPIPLGYNHGIYFYLSRDTRQVEALKSAEHTEANLSHLASTAYFWERSRFRKKGGKINWAEASDWLRLQCKKVGIFSPDRVRGRGAWLDDGKAILHLGDQMILDGQPIEIDGLESRFIYERASRMNIMIGKPLRPSECKPLLDILKNLNWAQSDMALLMAGFIVIAPVCGAMPWRPHLWMTSEAGGGKTWIIDNIIKPLIGEIALEVQSKTSEAGIRQALGSDARPVIFDEGETQNQRDRERMQQILDLARQASSEDGAPILKGSQQGAAQAFRIRSCFLFSSINLGLQQAADESRTIVLELISGRSKDENRGSPIDEKAEREEKFAYLSKLVAETITPEFAGRLLARTLLLLPVIRANADTFARAVSARFGSRRLGDTLGAVWAGYHSLEARKILTLDEAKEFIKGKDAAWVRVAAKRSAITPEHERCLSHLVEHVIRHTTDTGKVVEASIGELIADNTVASVGALARHGIRVKGIMDQRIVWFARAHSALNRLYESTPWATGWATTLMRLPNAVRNDKTMRFGAAVNRAVGIPYKVVLPEEEVDEKDLDETDT